MRALGVIGVGLLVSVAALSQAASGAERPEVVGLTLTGVVDPFEASYLTSGIDAAGDEGAAAVLLTIDTPGGLDSSMRQIIKSILNSNVPVVCYVSPEGARAASAGAFILTACHIAAMSPGTNVGAASPVGVTGAIEQRKVLNDSIAYIRSLAERRGRNPEWAEDAVRDARSSSAEEALRLDVIDLIAGDQSQLLDEVDGKTVVVPDGTTRLDTADARVVDREMGVATSLLHGLLTPDLAFIFFYLGIILLIVEFLHPGLSVPGVLGVLSLLAAFASFGMLPVSLFGLVLLASSAAFFLLELKHPGLSFPGIAGLILLIVGGLLLFDRPGSGVSVSLWAIVPVAGILVLFFALAIPRVLKARHLPVRSGLQRLVGTVGEATTDLKPEGTARIGYELWSVESVGGDVGRGQPVRVVEAEGLRLKVEPATEEEAAPAVTEERGAS